MGLVALSKDLGLLGSKRLSHETMDPELQPNSVERRPQSPRRPVLDTPSSAVSSSADAIERGHASEQQGRVGAPSLAELVQMLKLMLCGDEATPQRSSSGWKVAAATTGRRRRGRSPVQGAGCAERQVVGCLLPCAVSEGGLDGHCGVKCTDRWRVRAAGRRLLQL